jgi:hypothetical protein
MTTSAEWTPSDSAWRHAASTAAKPSVRTAARILGSSPRTSFHHLPVAVVGPGKLRRTRSNAVGSTQSLNARRCAERRACAPEPARNARDHKPSRRGQSCDDVRRRSARPGGSRCDRRRHGYRPDGRPRSRSPSTCCCRTGPGRSSTPRPARRGSRRSGRDRNELRPLLFEDLPDRLLGPLGVGMRFRPGEALVEKPGVSS